MAGASDGHGIRREVKTRPLTRAVEESGYSASCSGRAVVGGAITSSVSIVPASAAAISCRLSSFRCRTSSGGLDELGPEQVLRRRVEELPRDLGRLGERAIGEAAFVVQLLVRRTVDRKRAEDRERLLDDSIGVPGHRVDRNDGMDEVAGQRHELGRGRVAQPELVADSFLHSVLEDAHRSS